MPQTPSPAQNGNWMDVTVGTDMPFNTHVAAYASLAQGEHTTSGEEFLYTLGVNANF